MPRDQRQVGDWEDRARLFLIRTAGDTAGVPPVLEAIEKQVANDPAVKDYAAFELERARQGLLQRDEGLHLLLMFVWDASLQCFRPFASPTFDKADITLRSALINEMVDLSLRYKANGILVRSFGAPDSGLVSAVFDECQTLIEVVKDSMKRADKH